MTLSKFLLVAVVVATSVVAAVALGRTVALQRCSEAECKGTCKTIVEWPTDQCHPVPSLRGELGEQLHVDGWKTLKPCFRETIYEKSCAGKVLQSAPRVCDQCFQDEFGDPFKFFKYTGCGTKNMTLHRGCDYGCKDCNELRPLEQGKCHTFPLHPILKNFAWELSNDFKCTKEISADTFRFPTCDGQPDFVVDIMSYECYTLWGIPHKYVPQ